MSRSGSSSEKRYIEVALPLPLFQTFTYSIEGEPPPEGTRVVVPFRRDEHIGWVVGVTDDPGPHRIRSILDRLDRAPSLRPDILELARWMAEYYLAPLGLVLRTVLPSVLSDSSSHLVRPLSDAVPTDLTARQAKVWDALRAAPAPLRASTLRKRLGLGSIWPEIRALSARELVHHELVPPADATPRRQRVLRIVEWVESLGALDELFARSPKQRELYEHLQASGGAQPLADALRSVGTSASVARGLSDKGLVSADEEEVVRDPFQAEPPPPPRDIVPTDRQRAVIAAILGTREEAQPTPVLLHGVTGSGKTLVYIELLRRIVVDEGRGAIVLVPEISLTPQTVSRFRSHFGDRVAVLHSALSEGERFDAWRQLAAGTRRIVVGARSAIFAPIENLGAIIVDEEHEGSYKQSEAPRYHARDIAVLRARATGAVCVLGSATPSLESWRNAEVGKYRKVDLPDRVGGGTLPEIRVVDRREESARAEGSAGRVLSPELADAMGARLRRGEQVVLLLNRRGYANFVQCYACGHVPVSPDCSVSLTYHRLRKKLVCHYSGYEEPVPRQCAKCGSTDLSFRGSGTEQVEQVVAETFPSARIARMDVDTTSGKWSHHEILGRVERGEVDVLLGTQMIAKGLDFPNVTLVGVVNADVGLHLPDFRASERVFQLLSQVAGRAGRGEKAGEVVIQTRVPESNAIRYAAAHDMAGFARGELKEREALSYPPHTRIVNVILSSPDPDLAARGAEAAARWAGRAARGYSDVERVGPAPSPIERLHGRYRWHFFLRSPSSGALGRLGWSLLREFTPPPGDLRIVLDRDPVSLL